MRLPLPERPAWQRSARCRGMDLEIFFPTRGETALVLAAKKICEECPVRLECARAGRNEKFGIWGGVGEKTRKDRRSPRSEAS